MAFHLFIPNEGFPGSWIQLLELSCTGPDRPICRPKEIYPSLPLELLRVMSHVRDTIGGSSDEHAEYILSLSHSNVAPRVLSMFSNLTLLNRRFSGEYT